MKITIYELLGMVKDGKAPKRIKFENYIYIWRDIQKDYFCEQINHSLESIIEEYLFNNLNLEVEILEEEKKIPEKLKIEQDKPGKQYYIRNEYGTKCGLTQHSKMIVETLNQLIDYLKSKGDE